MLYKVIISLIEKGKTEGLAERVDVLYAAGKLATEEYEDILSKLKGE